MDSHAQPPVTIEGWYALHQTFALDRRVLRALSDATRADAVDCAARTLAAIATPANGGWSIVVQLVGSAADVLLLHLRPTLDEILAARADVAALEATCGLRQTLAFLSITELGLYHVPPDADDDARDAAAVAARDGAHARHRLHPALPPASMPYVSFYPTSKRRRPAQNWYTLPLHERSALMQRHGLIGRQHAAAVRQIITGAVGLDTWEWGVTLFAADPLAFKRVVTDMRFDEASARYADFGPFYVGRIVDPLDWARAL